MAIESPPFFTPVLYPQPNTLSQVIGNGIEKGLHLSGPTAYVIEGNRVELRDERIPCWELGLKVALFVGSLGLIPLVLLVAKAFYRLSTTFHITEKEVRQTPPNLICELKAIGQECVRKGTLTSDNRIKVKHEEKKYLLSRNGKDIRIQQVTKTLGRGGFGKVTQLVDLESDESTALKVATPSKPARRRRYDDQELERANQDLKKEVDELQMLHAGGDAVAIQKLPITPVFQVVKTYEARSKLRYAYEGVEYTGSLDKLKVYKLSLENRLDIVYQIVKGMQFFRGKGVVHCDFKPGNILYIKDGEHYLVYISDFGSRFKKGDDHITTCTPRYADENAMAEVENSWTEWGKRYSAKKMDIHSLGKTLQDLLFGTSPNLKNIYRDRMNREMLNAGKNKSDVDHFFEILDRTVAEDSHNPLMNFIDEGKPSIEEVVKAVENVHSPSDWLNQSLNAKRVHSSRPVSHSVK